MIGFTEKGFTIRGYRWLSNMLDPRVPRGERVVTPMPGETRDQAIESEDAWLVSKLIADPQPTEAFDVHQLRVMGIVGIYEPENAPTQKEP